MNPTEDKTVLVADATLPTGVLANTAAILGITLGARLPQIVGPDVSDGSGVLHPGITVLPLPVLKGDPLCLRQLRERLKEPVFQEVYVADFSDVAQHCQRYEDYIVRAGQTAEADFTYLALLLSGPKALVNKLTGNLPLLR